MAMKMDSYTCGMVSTNTYFVETEEENFLIDCPDGILPFLRKIKEKGKKIDAILLSHGHFDHMMGLQDALSLFPEVRVYLSKDDRKLIEKDNKRILTSFGIPLSLYPELPGDLFLEYPLTLGLFRIIRTPGHTEGGVSLYMEKEGILFSGDTLFYLGEGRTDLGGDYTTLMESLRSLSMLPGETKVFPGHGEHTTIDLERRRLGFNPV